MNSCLKKNLSGAIIGCAVVSAACGEEWRSVESPAVPLPRLEAHITTGQRLSFLADGRLYLTGPFTTVNGAPHRGIARLQPNGMVDDSFHLDPNIGSPRFPPGPFVVDASGLIYFTGGEGNDAWVRLRRLAADGTLDDSYLLEAALDAPGGGVRAYLQSIRAGTQGRMLVAGRFDSLGGVAVKNVALLHADGSVDAAFQFAPEGSLRSAIPLPDGRWIVAMALPPPLATSAPQPSDLVASLGSIVISRVLANGTIDPSFTPHSSPETALNAGVHALALDESGRVVFAEPAPRLDPPAPYLVRLGRLFDDGKRDTSFLPVLPTILPDDTFPRGASPLIWIPPHVKQIIPDGAGRLVCVANWEDKTRGGVVRVTNDGEVEDAPWPGAASGTALWLTRDAEGGWWGEFSNVPGAPENKARIVRLLPSGTIDPSFNVETTADGTVSKAEVLSDGSIVLQGSFDLANGVDAPGLIVVKSDGSLQPSDTLAATGWFRTELVSVLADDSILVQQAPPRPIILMEDALVAAPTPADTLDAKPTLGRLFADGRLQALLPGEIAPSRAEKGWLDAGNRLVAHFPGAASRGDLESDLVRFTAEGAIDETFRATLDGRPLTLDAAGATADGVGAWASTWINGTQSLHRLGDNGQSMQAIRLRLSRDRLATLSPSAIVGVPGGVLIAGGFDAINLTPALGVARLDEDGIVDKSWGGWFVEGTFARSVVRAANGLLLVLGDLRTPRGTTASALLRADGLPEFNAPPTVTPGTKAALAPSGTWLSHLAPNETGVRRWQVTTAPEVSLSFPDQPVKIGDQVVFRLEWIGIPVSVEWLRDGAVIPGAAGFTYSLTAAREDNGAIFAVRIIPEVGAAFHSRPWRLSVLVPEPRTSALEEAYAPGR